MGGVLVLGDIGVLLKIGIGIHSVSLFTKKVSPKFTLTWDHWENCPIAKPSTKKWFLGPDKYGPCHKSKEKLGEIRSLLVTLPGTLWVQKFFFLY